MFFLRVIYVLLILSLAGDCYSIGVGSVKRAGLRSLWKASLQIKSRTKPLRIIIAGAPASGKGTQCEIIKDVFSVVHISTGELLRNAVRDCNELGIKVKKYMETGSLVPDDLITDVVCQRLNKPDCQERGWLLDGFPRTKFQADSLYFHKIIPDCFLLLDVPESLLLARVSGRRSDPLTGKIYHLVNNPPPTEEIALRCIQRDDDTPPKIIRRYQDYRRHIDDVIELYGNCIVRVDGGLPPSNVSEIILNALHDIAKS